MLMVIISEWKIKQNPKHQNGTEKRGWNKRMSVIKLTFGHYNWLPILF